MTLSSRPSAGLLHTLGARGRGRGGHGAYRPGRQHWHFTVLLDGKRIGVHDFTVTPHGDCDRCRHRGAFQGQSGLHLPLSIRPPGSRGLARRLPGTDHQPDPRQRQASAVQGELQADAFEVHGSRGAATLPACVKTFAYWDQRFLTEPRLLNSQTGEFQAVTLSRAMEPRTSWSGGQMVPAQRYSLRGPKLEIDCGTPNQADWVGLESKLESGRTLRYEIQ